MKENLKFLLPLLLIILGAFIFGHEITSEAFELKDIVYLGMIALGVTLLLQRVRSK